MEDWSKDEDLAAHHEAGHWVLHRRRTLVGIRVARCVDQGDPPESWAWKGWVPADPWCSIHVALGGPLAEVKRKIERDHADALLLPDQPGLLGALLEDHANVDEDCAVRFRTGAGAVNERPVCWGCFSDDFDAARELSRRGPSELENHLRETIEEINRPFIWGAIAALAGLVLGGLTVKPGNGHESCLTPEQAEAITLPLLTHDPFG